MSDRPTKQTTEPDLRDEAENLSQWMIFLGEQAKDIPRLVRAAGVMRDLIADNKRLRVERDDLSERLVRACDLNDRILDQNQRLVDDNKRLTRRTP